MNLSSGIIQASESSGNVDFTKICVLVLLIAALSLLLKNFGFKAAPVFVSAVFLAVVCHFADTLGEGVAVLEYFAEAGGISKYSNACIKVIGIGYLSGISADTCREIGEIGAARCISIVSKLELIAISIPFIKEMFDYATFLIE